jgi:hypothetical protein
MDGGGFAQAKPASSGPLIVAPAIPNPMHYTASGAVGIVGTGAVPDTGMVVRATYVGPALTDGYLVRYSNNGVTMIWNLERVNSSVTTVLSSLDVTADATKQLTSALRSLSFKAEDRDPVLLTVVFNGFTIFEYYDLSSSRIRTTGKVALFGGST